MNLFGRHNSSDNSEQANLIAACLRNEPQAQKTLIREHYGFAKNISRRYASSDEDAEEILNDSFLKVFNKLGQYDPKYAFKAWLRTIVVNTSIDYYRRSLNQPVTGRIEMPDIASVTEDAISNISAEEILELVRKLSPVYRMVFTMFVIDGYSHKEIAEKLNIKEGTSKSNLQDARLKLQSMILKMNSLTNIAYANNSTLK
jgi:RNA polymerase sigma-70 factor (ECF subfamily)